MYDSKLNKAGVCVVSRAIVRNLATILPLYLHRSLSPLCTSAFWGSSSHRTSWFLAEKGAVDKDGKQSDFHSYADALWWGVVSTAGPAISAFRHAIARSSSVEPNCCIPKQEIHM